MTTRSITITLQLDLEEVSPDGVLWTHQLAAALIEMSSEVSADRTIYPGDQGRLWGGGDGSQVIGTWRAS